MKICFYALRPFDELAYCKQFSEKYGIDFTWTAEYPTAENVDLAKGKPRLPFRILYNSSTTSSKTALIAHPNKNSQILCLHKYLAVLVEQSA